MSEALVRTVEAIERTVCVDALPPRRMANSSLSFSALPVGSCQYCLCHSSRLFLIQNLQNRHVTRIITAIPPITPPAIGPAADLCGVDFVTFPVPELLLAPILVHCVEAQALQEGLINVHVSSEAQPGHLGFAFGSHCKHLRKRPRVVPVTSTMISVWKNSGRTERLPRAQKSIFTRRCRKERFFNYSEQRRRGLRWTIRVVDRYRRLQKLEKRSKQLVRTSALEAGREGLRIEVLARRTMHHRQGDKERRW